MEHRTIHTEHEDKARRMAIGAARRDRAESAAYHAAASDGTNPDGSLRYPAAGSTWTAMGLARLCSMGLAMATRAYRAAPVGPDQWSELHGALVAAALAKGSDPATCAECGQRAAWSTPTPSTDGSGYPTCLAHRPVLTRRVSLPAREAVGVAYWEATATEDADGNLIEGRQLVARRVKRQAGEARVPIGRRIDAEHMPTVGEVNGAWAIERAKGMLADMWAGATVPTAWETDTGDDAEDGSEAEDVARWGSALQWEDVAPHLAATAPAERMALDCALTGITLSEAGSKATVYGAPKPLSHPAARKAASRAAKGMAARLTPDDVRAAVIAALSEAEDAETATGEATTAHAPSTMRNGSVPVWEARLDLASIANRRALRSAWLARHLWPMRRTPLEPFFPTREVVALPVLIGSPALPVRMPAWRDTRAATAARRAWSTAQRKRQSEARAAHAARIAADPMRHYGEVWARADAAIATARDLAASGASTPMVASAESTARAMLAHAARATSTPTRYMPARQAGWTAEDRTRYLSTLPRTIPLTVSSLPTVAAQETAADAARKVAAARDRARTIDSALADVAPAVSGYSGAPGADVAPWRVDGACGPMQTRKLSTREAKREADARREHAARVAALPSADRKDWQRRSDAQIARAKRRAERAA